MYPIMGIIFAVIWIALAFIGGGPATIVLMIVALLDAVFGIFLIFLPVTAFLGLFYVAIGAFTIAISKHNLGGSKALYFLVAMTVLIFLLTGGLTFFANTTANYIDIIASSINSFSNGCEDSMNIDNWENNYWNLDTRCENWALFEAFVVFFLFLLQPIAVLELFFKKSGGGGGGGAGGQGAGHSAGHSGQSTTNVNTT